MLPHGLKTNIAIHIASLLLLAMLLINFVLVTAGQKDLVRSEILRGSLLLSIIEREFFKSLDSYHAADKLSFEKEFERILNEGQVSHTLILDKDAAEIYFRGSDENLKKELKGRIRQTIGSGKKTTQYFGEIWGVFWKQRQYVILTAPFFRGGKIVAAASIGLPLERIYKALRRSQKILLSFILGNAAILTLLGLSSLSKIIVKPLNRLVGRAEGYREDDDIFFMYEKEGSEFSKLSGALNRMLTRIAADKEKLQSTIQSLEKANKELSAAQKDIIRAEKLASLGRLSSGIAHEIGNPIGIVIGYLELLKQKDIMDDERNEFIGRAEKEVNRINTIIRQLLDFSKSSDTGLKAVSVHETIKDTVNVLNVQPMMKKIVMNQFLAAEKDAVMADPDQLRQVFLNLILNACDAIVSDEPSGGGKIDIATGVENNTDPETGKTRPSLKITLVDNGPGIACEHIDNIFDPFYTTKKAGEGTGLGLWVSFLMIDGIGGTIQATSKPNQGTAITIYLPLHSEVKDG